MFYISDVVSYVRVIDEHNYEFLSRLSFVFEISFSVRRACKLKCQFQRCVSLSKSHKHSLEIKIILKIYF